VPELPFFDCNCRIGRPGIPRPEWFTDARGLLAEMDQAGIDRALVHHVWSAEWSPHEGNQALLAEIGGESRLHPCFVALPPATQETPPPRELARQVKELRGAVRLFPKLHGYLPDAVTCGHLFDVFGDFAVPVLIDIGQTSWAELADLLERHPALNVIVLGVYYRINRYVFPLLERFGNLHLESGTYGAHRGVEEVCRLFGAERLIFGTDLPIHEVGGPMALVTYASVGDDAKRLIASGNLSAMLGEVS
jgi:predicted TIM-barrel fold metal-dependent hydrolase